jgi:hypothetical protein
VLILGEAHLRAVLAEYQLHYNTAPAAPGHRPARAPDDERAAPRAAVTDVGTQQIRRKPILNGLINEYTHAAWRTEDLQVTQPNPIFERDRIESAAERLDVAGRKFKTASRPERPVREWLPGSG